MGWDGSDSDDDTDDELNLAYNANKTIFTFIPARLHLCIHSFIVLLLFCCYVIGMSSLSAYSFSSANLNTAFPVDCIVILIIIGIFGRELFPLDLPYSAPIHSAKLLFSSLQFSISIDIVFCRRGAYAQLYLKGILFGRECDGK